MLRFIFSFSVIVFVSISARAQHEYQVDTFTTSYDTLTDYKSLVYELFIEGEFPGLFGQEFEFGFDMPYWDTVIHKISLDNEQIGLLEGSKEYNMFLFAADWQIYNPLQLSADTSFYSDYRYKTGDVEGKKYFALEYRHVSHNNWNRQKPQGGSGDFNFQSWFWENGDIDIRFGKVRTTDTTLFLDNFGLITTDENGEGQWKAGIIGIENYTSTKGLYYTRNYDKPRLIYSPFLLNELEINPITTLPHEGFVIRFKRQSSATQEPKKISFVPNIVTDELVIPEDINFSKYSIYTPNGQLLQEGTENHIATGQFATGYYFIRLVIGNGLHSFKFYKS